MSNEDIKADISMTFMQIISLLDLMIEHNNNTMTNILTLRDLVQEGLNNSNMF